MLNSGYVFCPNCGYATNRGYYYCQQISRWIEIKRDAFGNPIVSDYTPPNSSSTNDEVYSFQLLSNKEDFRKGFPLKVSVLSTVYETEGAEKTKLTFARSCPHCAADGIKEVPFELADLPTYVVAVIGERAVGKSCFIHALSCPHNINAVNRFRTPEEYRLTAETLADEHSIRPEATEINDIGNTRVMTITKKTGGKSVDIAQVLVVDFPGEIFSAEMEEEFNRTAAHIFKGGEGYSGVDAILFIMDPSDINPSREIAININPVNRKYSIATTYNRVSKELNLLGNRPFAFIMNKTDLFFDHPDNYTHLANDSSNPRIPLITEHTFTNQLYIKSEILPRFTLQTELLRKLFPILQTVENYSDCAGFFVKTSEPVLNPDSAEHVNEPSQFLNFTKSINVMDPFLWILNKLDIFPIYDD